jgi:fructose-1,6-bisphosphatase/inositol monophosphatase family enzyme
VASELVELAGAVRAAVLESAGSLRWGETVGMGADGTPTKWIDEHAERVLLQELDRRGLDHNLLSEEAGFVDRGGRVMLIADPVDGTANAVRGIPFYCVSLALGRDRLSDVTDGVVVNIPTGDVYAASKGRGATLNGRPIKVREWAAGRDTVAVYLGPDAPAASFEAARMPKRVRGLGAAALEISLVAAGALDGHLQWGNPLRCTDIAAAALILREAGGDLYDFSGAILDMPLNMSSRRDVTATGSVELAARFAARARALRERRGPPVGPGAVPA